MNYYEQSGYQYNNQHPWKLDESEICFILADDCIKTHANKRPQKCWIPTIMGPKQLPKPKVTVLMNSAPFINDPLCKPPVSATIRIQNYINVFIGDHDHFDHKWFGHGAEVWLEPTNGDILELYLDTSVDPSFCVSCPLEHPSCNTVHGCECEC